MERFLSTSHYYYSKSSHTSCPLKGFPLSMPDLQINKDTVKHCCVFQKGFWRKGFDYWPLPGLTGVLLGCLLETFGLGCSRSGDKMFDIGTFLLSGFGLFLAFPSFTGDFAPFGLLLWFLVDWFVLVFWLEWSRNPELSDEDDDMLSQARVTRVEVSVYVYCIL